MIRQLTKLAWLLCLLAGTAFAQTQDFVLSEGDQIEFDLLDDDQPPRVLTIAQDGQIQLPLIGAVEIAGITVTEAMAKIRDEFINGDLLIDPKVSLSIAAFRPVFVLGDVQRPGLIDYRPLLTVEQAVGLSGGLITAAGDREQHLLTESSLRGEINLIDEDITRESVAIARLRAQQQGEFVITDEWLDPALRKFVNREKFQSLSAIELQILETDLKSISNDRDFLASELQTLEREIELLNRREVQQRDLVELFSSKLEQVSNLANRGLQTSTALTTSQSQLAEAEGSLLEITRRISESRRRAIEIRREISNDETKREKALLNEIQDRMLQIQKLASRRANISERLLLVSSWENDRTREVLSVESSFDIRRTTRGETTLYDAEITSRLNPGDVLLVTISLPDLEESIDLEAPQTE